MEDSTVTYTTVSSPFEGLSDIGSPGVDGPPIMPEDPYAYVVASFQAPSSLDYVSGLEEPEQAPLLPEFVLEHVYPEFMPLEDEVFPAEEQPLPAAVSYTTDSPGYIDDDDDVDEEDDEEGEEEHPALANYVLPPPVYRTIARISIPTQAPVPFLFEEEAERFLAIPTLPPSPLTPLSSPLPQIPLMCCRCMIYLR
ncbi:hypothetical protein Tco_1566431 [Tanacetum coccineum]